MKPTLLAVAVAVLSVACSSSNSSWDLDRPEGAFTPTSQGPADQASVVIGSGGGTVTTAGGSGVRIPSGALTSDVSITVQLATNAPLPSEGTPVGPTYLLGPEGQKFARPVTVTLEFDPTELFDGESADDIIIYTSPKENPSFVPLVTSVVDANHVSATTTHFSYVVAAHGNVKSLYTISYAPNSFVIGNAYPGWTDDLRGGTIFQKGGGNPKGVHYQCGFLFGENFDHCGWIDRNVVSGSAEDTSCGSGCADDYDTSLFKKTYTNGTVNPGVSDGQETHMHYSGSGCTDYQGFGNVSPWREPAKPANSLGNVPDGKLLLWRYVSKDGHWVLVRDPEPPKGKPNWYFVQRGCVSLAPPSATPPPPTTPSCGALEPGKNLGPTDEILSCNKNYWLSVAANGDLIETEKNVGELWTVDGQTGDQLDMQSDGNLVLYSGTTAIWQTMTSGHPGAYLSLQDDGGLAIIDGSTTLWSR
jgi:hypothetical protein